VFYYSLSNLKPSLRSVLQSIQLVAVVKTSFIDKYGVDTILEPFMDDVCKLEKVNIHIIHIVLVKIPLCTSELIEMDRAKLYLETVTEALFRS